VESIVGPLSHDREVSGAVVRRLDEFGEPHSSQAPSKRAVPDRLLRHAKSPTAPRASPGLGLAYRTGQCKGWLCYDLVP
jgi:hypothetical protein